MEEVVEGAVEDEAAFFKHEEGGVGVGLAFWEGYHAALVGVEAVCAEGEGVLEAVGDEQGWGLVDVSLLDDEFDDGGAGDRVETAGR